MNLDAFEMALAFDKSFSFTLKSQKTLNSSSCEMRWYRWNRHAV